MTATCTELECCALNVTAAKTCYASGFRDPDTDSTESSITKCPVGTRARDEDDEHKCAKSDHNGLCHMDEFCMADCFMSGWRDAGGSDDSMKYCKATEVTKAYPWSRCGYQVTPDFCTEAVCCHETCELNGYEVGDSTKCPAGKVPKKGDCGGTGCTDDACCFVGCTKWAEAESNTCPAESPDIKDWKTCPKGTVEQCSADVCCGTKEANVDEKVCDTGDFQKECNSKWGDEAQCTAMGTACRPQNCGGDDIDKDKCLEDMQTCVDCVPNTAVCQACIKYYAGTLGISGLKFAPLETVTSAPKPVSGASESLVREWVLVGNLFVLLSNVFHRP